MYETLKFSISTNDRAGDRDVTLVVMDHSIPPRFPAVAIEANKTIGVWRVSALGYFNMIDERNIDTRVWHVGQLPTTLGNPAFTIEGVAFHVSGTEDAPVIQVRSSERKDVEIVDLITGSVDGVSEAVKLGPQVCPVAISAGTGGGRASGGMHAGQGGGGASTAPYAFAPREELAPKPEPLQSAPLLREDVPSARIVAEDGDRRVEIEITNPGGAAYAAELAAEHLTAIVAALGGAK